MNQSFKLTGAIWLSNTDEARWQNHLTVVRFLGWVVKPAQGEHLEGGLCQQFGRPEVLDSEAFTIDFLHRVVWGPMRSILYTWAIVRSWGKPTVGAWSISKLWHNQFPENMLLLQQTYTTIKDQHSLMKDSHEWEAARKKKNGRCSHSAWETLDLTKSY